MHICMKRIIAIVQRQAIRPLSFNKSVVLKAGAELTHTCTHLLTAETLCSGLQVSLVLIRDSTLFLTNCGCTCVCSAFVSFLRTLYYCRLD